MMVVWACVQCQELISMLWNKVHADPVALPSTTRSTGSDRKSSRDGPLSSVCRNLTLDNGVVSEDDERARLTM